MFGGGSSSNLVWYQLGKWANESDQRHQRTKDLVFGRRTVQVDQSYIDSLHAAAQQAGEAADHNYAAGVGWRETSKRLEADLAHAKMLLADREAVIRQCDHTIAQLRDSLSQEREAHTKDRGNLYSLLGTLEILREAEKAGKAEWPDFQELKRLADEEAEIMSRGERFPGYSGEQYQRYLYLVRTLSA
jgi:hypothetical protein